MGTFKYHMMLHGGVTQTVRVPSYGGEGWSNHHITFIVDEKA